METFVNDTVTTWTNGLPGMTGGAVAVVLITLGWEVGLRFVRRLV